MRDLALALSRLSSGADAQSRDEGRLLEAVLAAQGAVIDAQAAALAHSEKIFARASAAARIGVWECDLATGELRWSHVVYEIFGLPREAALDREAIVALYEPASRVALEAARSRAITRRGGFTLDVRIVTPAGRRRWVRLTATVECDKGEPVRIFGMKQDITREKALAERTRRLAERDPLTGLANRGRFQARLAATARASRGQAGPGALALVDLDGFKQLNDRHGHAVGDACLREAGRRLVRAARGADLVARIGGDEFAVLLPAPVEARRAEALAARLVADLGRGVTREGATIPFGASVGIAFADGRPADAVFAAADAALYAAKAAGRGAYRVAVPG